MCDQAAHRETRLFRPSAIPILEKILVRLLERSERKVDVSSRTPIACGWLRHEGHKHAVAFRNLLQDDPKEDQAISHFEQVGIMKVELELRVRSFSHDIMYVPTQLFENIDHVL